MNRQLKIAELHKLARHAEVPAFDRKVLTYQTMDDAALAEEILLLFLGQLARLERINWAALELAFEMHTLRGAAAVVGAGQIEALADGWQALGSELEPKLKAAINDFRAAAAQA
jgi:hypothetical protein